eukprot:scaffold552_cov526-Prasinococcus_capsulatus_cf.AAC.19
MGSRHGSSHGFLPAPARQARGATRRRRGRGCEDACRLVEGQFARRSQRAGLRTKTEASVSPPQPPARAPLAGAGRTHALHED